MGWMMENTFRKMVRKRLPSDGLLHSMVPFILFFIVALAIPFSTFAKTSDTVGTMRLLDTSYTNKLPMDSALKSFKKAVSEVRKEGDEKILARLYISRGNLFYHNNDFENALVNYSWAYQLLRNYKASTYYFDDLLVMANTFYYLNKPDSLRYYTTLGMNEAQKQNNALYTARFYDKYGIYYEMINDNASALEYYRKALDYLTIHGKKIDIAREEINIGIIYNDMGDFDRAGSYYRQALKIGKALKDKDILSSCINNLGDLYNTRKKYDSALLFMNRSLEIDRRRKDSFGIVGSLNNVGTVEINLKKMKEARHHFRQALSIAQKKHFLLLEALSLENLGDFYGDTATTFYEIDTAIKLYRHAMSIAKKIDSQEYTLGALSALQKFYAIKGNYKIAFDFAKQYQVLNDTIYNRESASQLQEIKVRYESERREKELLNSQQKAERTKLISVIISLLLVVLIGILFLISRTRYLKNRKLKQQQQFVDILLENASSHVVILSKNRMLKYISPSFEKEFGLDLSKLPKQELFRKIHPDDLPRFMQDLDRVEKMQLQKVVFECRMENKKGNYRFITGMMSNKLNDETLNGLLINFWDVTRQKAYEKELEESEKKYRDIFEAFSDIYFRENLEGVLIEISPSVEKITGYKQEEVLGKSADIFYQNQQKEDRAGARQELISKGEIHDNTIILVKKDGTPFVCSFSGKLIMDDHGQPVGIEGVVRDITEREKQEQQLREANETKDKLFSIIAHDLVGPIGVQKNSIDLILLDIDRMPKEEIVSLLKSMKPSLDATFFMIENLLSWARIMRKSIEPRIIGNTLYPLVAQIFEFLQAQADAKHIQLIYRGERKIKAFFDKNLMEIVLRNLITNAMKFSPEGSTVFVDVERKGAKVKISVLDKGIGIPPDILKNLQSEKHKSYSRLGTQNEKGTGIGLIVVKEFIHKNKSRLTMESQVGKGSVFSFELPVA